MAASSPRFTRSSAASATRSIQSQLKRDIESDKPMQKGASRRRTARRNPSESDASAGEESEEPPPKRRKSQPAKSRAATTQLHTRLFGPNGPESQSACCAPPARRHGINYHRPILLDDASSRSALLAWFDSVSTKRSMPWRKAWINPPEHPGGSSDLRRALERRAYEVWISEIMLQQTRVAVVIDYWNRWMAKWPTIHDLAAASSDDVLSAWRGLGYYSRATRIHEAAKLVVQDPDMTGLLPSRVEQLEAKVPGVGRYTAGAISAIVFGRAVPMVDGNVLRVLSRQLGLYGNTKTDKTVIDLLWAAAGALAKAVAQDRPEGSEEQEAEEESVSDRPGRWGQALMELGSTVCAPKPNCADCPITSSCRAYGEGKVLAGVSKATKLEDIEDMCHLCEPLEAQDAEEESGDTPEPAKPAKTTKGANGSGKQTKLWAFAFKGAPEGEKKKPATSTQSLSDRDMDKIVDHARKFPLKVAKKEVRKEETLVCVIRRTDGQYLIHKRPEKGLLAGLWEFPSYILQDADAKGTSKQRRTRATSYVTELLSKNMGPKPRLKDLGELESVPWLFSHIKLTMHVHMFELEMDDGGDGGQLPVESRLKWASERAIDDESMGTGMRKCWALAKNFEL